MNVRIYFNFHKQMLSVQTKIEGRWKVVSHTKEAYLKNAKFKVSEAGRQRVIKNKRKNVHAFICGTLIDSAPAGLPYEMISYNPYLRERFFNFHMRQYVDQADFVELKGRHINAFNSH